MMSKLVSPNDLQTAAREHMLEGREPVSHKDWALCANFWAANVSKGVETSAVPLIGMIFNCPLSRDELVEIATYQAERK
jgi:uncharacterized protein (DUF2237 family)